MRTISVSNSRALAFVVGVVAIVAPILHSSTDVMEWSQGGFSDVQLWLNYVAFAPMPWLLLGLYVVHENDMGWPGLLGALLHGVAFTYFSYTTLLALGERVPTYEQLWERLGIAYTVHGGFMVVGGLLFAVAARRARELPTAAVALFAAGLTVNLVLAMVPAPDILQTLGTAIRNAGLVGMGYAVLARARRRSANEPS